MRRGKIKCIILDMLNPDQHPLPPKRPQKTDHSRRNLLIVGIIATVAVAKCNDRSPDFFEDMDYALQRMFGRNTRPSQPQIATPLPQRTARLQPWSGKSEPVINPADGIKRSYSYEIKTFEYPSLEQSGPKLVLSFRPLDDRSSLFFSRPVLGYKRLEIETSEIDNDKIVRIAHSPFIMNRSLDFEPEQLPTVGAFPNLSLSAIPTEQSGKAALALGPFKPKDLINLLFALEPGYNSSPKYTPKANHPERIPASWLIGNEGHYATFFPDAPFGDMRPFRIAIATLDGPLDLVTVRAFPQNSDTKIQGIPIARLSDRLKEIRSS